MRVRVKKLGGCVALSVLLLAQIPPTENTQTHTRAHTRELAHFESPLVRSKVFACARSLARFALLSAVHDDRSRSWHDRHRRRHRLHHTHIAKESQSQCVTGCRHDSRDSKTPSLARALSKVNNNSTPPPFTHTHTLSAKPAETCMSHNSCVVCVTVPRYLKQK